MSTDAAEQIALALIAVRGSDDPAALTPEAISAIDIDTAFRVQNLTAQHLRKPIAAWKVSAPAGVGPVLAAPIFAELIFQAPATLPRRVYGQAGAECEIAFRIGRTIAPRNTPYSREEIVDHIEGALVACEFLSSRLPARLKSPRNALLADMLSNAALVVGETVADWHGRDLKNIAIVLDVNGETAISRQGGHPSDDPLGGVVALANLLGASGTAIEAGHYVTTGSYTGVHTVSPGDKLTVRFAGFPGLHLTLDKAS